jgi:hypothetical protein
MKKVSTYTEDLELDLCAWLDDIAADMAKGNIKDIEDSARVIGNLPQFVQGWTVSELVAAIMDR